MTETVDALDPATLLTVDGFDFDKVSQMIDASSLSELRKTTMKAALEQARSNPALLQGALDQIRSLMGL